MGSTGKSGKDTLLTHDELVTGLIEGYLGEKDSSGKVRGFTEDRHGTAKSQTASHTPHKRRMSIADLIRLLQFQRELEKERPADIVEVRWIDPNEEI